MELDNNFLTNYSEVISEQKKKVQDALESWELEDKNLFELQRKYANRYKKEICKYYMNLWNKSGKFPRDDELTDAVFFIGGLDIERQAPDIRLSLYDNQFRLEYKNTRLDLWVKL